ncbi:hypothetical protein M8J75_005594 [Diaphorina citri]|nr:hypothetical protein M8J75_005594 [Diaphorina citri]
MGRSETMMLVQSVLVLIFTYQTQVWCSPSPQGVVPSAQVSLSVGSLPSGSNGSAGVGISSSMAQTGGVSGSGFVNQRPARPQFGISFQTTQYQGNSANLPVPFLGHLLGSVGGLGSSVVNAKTQSASQLMDGVSYGISRVPSFVGYGVQSAGRLEKAGEQLFKAAIDLGTGGLTNGMQGLTMGMNMMNGLGTAGMKGFSKVANGSAQILEHILSLGVTESGLFNTLVALSRLMSPGQGSFLSSGLNLTALTNAANYLGIPENNENLNTILSAASKLQANMANAGINMNSISSAANAASNIDLAAIRQAANSAVQNLGLSTAWNILSSRFSSGNSSTPGQNGQMEAVQAAATSNTTLPVSASVNIGTGNIPRVEASTNSSGSWMDWLG